jgi:CheY-like chemotaxis protein
MGKGSTFTVFLPSAGNAGKKDDAKTKISGNNSVASILFVDDEESITSSVQRLLKNAGYEITTCTSAKSAIEVFDGNSEAFDIVITDQYMPEMTGDIMVEKLRTIRREIPAILCTGYGQKEVFDDMKKAGFQIVLFKPVSKLDYIKAINKLLNT